MPEITFTVLALALTRTTTAPVHRVVAGSAMPVFSHLETRTEEIGRVEFIPMGAEWTLVRVLSTPGERGRGHCWTAMKAEDARKLYQAHTEGCAGYIGYSGKWTPVEPHTKVLRSMYLPARRVSYDWGESAWMYCDVDLPAMECPVLELARGRRCALQPFILTVPDAVGLAYPGGRYRGHTSNRIFFAHLDPY